jgi:hypothetical protein
VNDPLDLNVTNDFYQVTACAKKHQIPASAALGGVDDATTRTDVPTSRVASTLDQATQGGGAELIVQELLPAYMKPGEHTLALKPSVTRSYVMDRFLEDGSCGPRQFQFYLAVGWFQVELTREGPFGIELRDCAYVGEGQTAVNFNYGIFDDILDPRITRAELTFDEQPLAWQDTDGSHRQIAGCVAALDIAGEQWYLPNVDLQPIRGEAYRDVTPTSTRRFDVTSATAQHILNKRPRDGFVLRGSLAVDDLEGEGQSSCISAIDHLLLTVTYVVP